MKKDIFIKKFFFKYIFAIYSFIDVYYELRSYERGVAQLGSAGALGALGRRFESCRPDSNNPSHRKVSQPVFIDVHIMTAMVAVKLRSKRLN